MELEATRHTMDKYLRAERIPHIWCPGCGLGTVLNCFLHALEENDTDLQNLAIVSGIGCTGRIAGYVNVDSITPPTGGQYPLPRD